MKRILVEIDGKIVKYVKESELEMMTKNLYSISRHGYWDGEHSVIVIEINGKLNRQLQGFWTFDTEYKLVKYYGYTEQELREEQEDEININRKAEENKKKSKMSVCKKIMRNSKEYIITDHKLGGTCTVSDGFRMVEDMYEKYKELGKNTFYTSSTDGSCFYFFEIGTNNLLSVVFVNRK